DRHRVARLLQLVGGGESGESGAEDEDLAGYGGRRGLCLGRGRLGACGGGGGPRGGQRARGLREEGPSVRLPPAPDHAPAAIGRTLSMSVTWNSARMRWAR